VPPCSKACRPFKDIGNRIIKNGHGRQIGLKPLTAAPEFYAAMVIGQECFHHLRFGEVVVQAQLLQSTMLGTTASGT
jgi:hypothetical protein